jgi:hypothetical protein
MRECPKPWPFGLWKRHDGYMLTTTICAALSAAGLAVALLTAFRRRFVAATRIAAVALLPIGLAMSGLLGLAGAIVREAGNWAADLVLKPSVWAGFAVLACAVVLYVIARTAARRSTGRKERATEGGDAVPPTAGASALPARERATEKPRAAGDGGKDDFSEIEEILKKHGI